MSHDAQAPVRLFLAGVALTIPDGAEIALSGPIVFCRSPRASINAIRALLRAADIALPCDDARKLTAESDSSPMPTIVSKTNRLMVMISVKPLLLRNLFTDSSMSAG